jgi:hypothetical protein
MNTIYSGDKLNLLLSLFSAIATWVICTHFIDLFTCVGNLELIIFSGSIGFGIGTIASLIILSLMSIIYSGLGGLLNLLGLWFWSGSYIAITIGGTTGSVIGTGCAIFTRLWN